MPLVKVINSNYFNQVSPITYILDGAQYIENVLTLPTSPDTTTIYLSEDLHNSPGYYVLFDYSESTAPIPVVGSVSQIIIDNSNLTSPLLSGATTVFNDTTSKQIVVIVYGN